MFDMRRTGLIITMLTSLGLMDAVEHIPDIVHEISDLTEELDHSTLSGAEKFELAAKAVANIIDAHTDWLPGWSELSEQARDRIVYGLVEVAVQISRKARGGKQRASSFRLRLDNLREHGIAAAIERRMVREHGIAAAIERRTVREG